MSNNTETKKTSFSQICIGLGIIVGAILVLGVMGLIIFRITFVTFVDNYEFAFVYDAVHGKTQIIPRTGYVVYTPFINSVHTVDLRPYQISITPGAANAREGSSTGGNDVSKRVLNAKLVRFNPSGLDKFLEWHGRSAADSLDNMLMILKAYAFDRDNGTDCPFLTIVNELAPTQGGQISTGRSGK